MRLARRGRRILLLLLLGALGVGLVGCDRERAPVTRLVEVTRLVTIPSATSTDGVLATRLTLATATPGPAREQQGGSSFTTKDPTHYRALVAAGPRTLDPALVTDAASRHLVQNVVEPLIRPDPRQPDTFLPLLATRWLSAEEGLTYTFFIRPGVIFSNGNSLTAGDVAYSLQRGLLQSAPGGPFGLLMAPLLDYASGDITEAIAGGLYAGDPDELRANASDAELEAVCERVQEAIVADDEAGSVTFSLARRWSPFPAVLSQPWAAIVDREWAVEQGAWDGNCQTWEQWYAPAAGESALATKIMGTGPYILDHWTPDVEYTLVRNEAYWAEAPLLPRAEGTAPETVTVGVEPDPFIRWQAFQTGHAETSALSREIQLLAEQLAGEICTWPGGQCRATRNSSGPVRHHTNLIMPERAALFFNFNISSDGNPFIGSGQLDGNGIPPNFFSDPHVRRAFAACFDEARFIEETLDGQAQGADTLFAAYYPEVSALAPPPLFDPALCAEELATAWNNLLPETGFWLQLPVEAGNRFQQQAALLLQEGLQAAGNNYTVEIVGLARPAYLQALAAGQLPLALLHWTAHLPDPHSWVAPTLDADVLDFQRLPSDLQARFTTLLEQGVATEAAEERMAIYQTLDAERREWLPYILLPQATGDHYEQRWVHGWFYHPAFHGPYYDAYTLAGGQ